MPDEPIDAEVVDETPPPRRDSSGALVVLSKQVGADGDGLSIFDTRLLSLAVKGLSPAEIAAEMGHIISPLRVAQRTKEILASRSWLSLIEREELVLQEVIDLKEEVKGVIRQYSEMGSLSLIDTKWITALNKLFTTLLTVFENRRRAIAEEKMSLRTAQAQVMVAALETGFDLFYRDVLAPLDVDEAEAREVLEHALPRAIAIIEGATDQTPAFTLGD